MSAITTSAPARASVSASARPSPREPPVTSATRPERSISSATRAILRGARHLRRDELDLRRVAALALDLPYDVDRDGEVGAGGADRRAELLAYPLGKVARRAAADDDA